MYFTLITFFFMTALKMSTATHELNNRKSESPTYIQSGVVKLIIEAYTDNLLRELEAHSHTKLSASQSTVIRQKLNQLHDHIVQHPSLRQSRLWVGDEEPTKTDNDDEDGDNGLSYYSVGKRRPRYPPQEVCRTNPQWEIINITHDFYNKPVQIVQDSIRQYVFTYRCVQPAHPCTGVSYRFRSECTERYGWVYVYYRKLDPPNSAPEWGYVAVPHHCACKITR
ncbi:uncharacterized protein [Centruroides vittatus]|uniref:uncharacterized protein LOC111626498 n=1 Tax=Centruroides sculpturatus TaxID=218467 RepID=UPI000C6D3146|nr:uncharacterized protein LOC111626498 [Centruroides sculpturatus]